MVEPLFVLSPWPQVHEITIVQDPKSQARTATISVWDKDRLYRLDFVNPEPLHDLVRGFNCHSLKVIDRNIDNAAQLKFGRYRLEFWDGANPIGEVTADDFVYEVGYPVSSGA